jgi:hypothetical protein
VALHASIEQVDAGQQLIYVKQVWHILALTYAAICRSGELSQRRSGSKNDASEAVPTQYQPERERQT